MPAGQCVGLLGPNGAGKTTTVESLEGLHFSASRFPAWMQPVVQLLPLTALNDSLRAIMTDGVSLLALGRQLLVLVLWGLVPFALAVRYFRWT